MIPVRKKAVTSLIFLGSTSHFLKKKKKMHFLATGSQTSPPLYRNVQIRKPDKVFLTCSLRVFNIYELFKNVANFLRYKSRWIQNIAKCCEIYVIAQVIAQTIWRSIVDSLSKLIEAGT